MQRSILIRDDRIEAIGPTATTPIPATARVLDLAGHTVIPGIVGLHEHTWFGGVRVSTPMAARAPLYLAMGVTSAMTAGTGFAYDELNLKRSVDADLFPGPRFEITGPYLVGGPQRPTTGQRIVTSAEEVRRTVAYWGSEGATWFTLPRSTITATITRDDATLTISKRIDVKSPAPSVFDFSAQMLPEAVRPEPVIALGDGVIFLTRGAERVEFKMLWSLLTGRPSSAHLHGPDGSDSIAEVMVDLPLGNRTRSFGVVTGSFSAADIRAPGGSPAVSLDSLITLIRGRRVYVDLHTPQFVDGELRGSVFRPR